MKFTLRHHGLSACAVCWILLLCGSVVAQVAGTGPSRNNQDPRSADFEDSLDQFRGLDSVSDSRLNFASASDGGDLAVVEERLPGVAEAEIKGYLTIQDPRKSSLKKINVLRKRLKSSEHDREKVAVELKSALTEYFLADMKMRVKELDEIKQMVVETEAKLQQRLGEKDEAVDLQLKLMLREADGFGFFHRDDVLGGLSKRSVLVGPAAQLPGPLAPSVPTFVRPPVSAVAPVMTGEPKRAVSR